MELLMIVNVVIMNMMKLRRLIVKQLYIYLNQGNAYLNNMLRIGLRLDAGAYTYTYTSYGPMGRIL